MSARRSVLLLFALWSLGAGPARAEFENLGASARAVGMGGAFTAVADDAASAHFNPAGLAGMPGPEFQASYGRLHLGLDDQLALSKGWFAFAYPMRRSWGAAALGWNSFSAGGEYRENVVRLAYARHFSDALRCGLTLKWMSLQIQQDSYTALDPVFDNGGKNASGALGLDAGMLWQVLPRLRLGAALTDVNRPDLTFASGGAVPLGWRVGAAYPTDRTTLSGEVSRRDGETVLASGLERWWLKGRVAARGGLEIGSSERRRLSLGLSYGEDLFRLDYSFVQPLSGFSGTAGTHQFALVLHLGALPIQAATQRERAVALEGTVRDQQGEIERLQKSIHDLKHPKPKAAPVKKKESGPVRHTVAAGDTLRSVAQRYYKDAERWIEIFNANRGAVDSQGDLIPGKILTLPTRTTP